MTKSVFVIMQEDWNDTAIAIAVRESEDAAKEYLKNLKKVNKHMVFWMNEVFDVE